MHFRKGEIAKTATCLILDGNSVLIARGTYSGAGADGGVITIKVFDGDVEDVAKRPTVQLVSIQNDGPTCLCQVKNSRGDIITLEPLRTLDAQVRRNLRIPVEFDSYIYPLPLGSGGQVRIVSNDLSCGGISFYTEKEFQHGDQFEVVIPITPVNPLVLKGEIIRLCEQREQLRLYAAQFSDMINDEETLVRQTVFSVQIRNR